MSNGNLLLGKFLFGLKIYSLITGFVFTNVPFSDIIIIFWP